MKKIFKRKDSMSTPEIEQDVVALINQVQQRLVSLERKIDTLINKPPERSFEGKHFSKPFQRFDRHNRFDRGNRDNDFRERSYTKAICADCNKECEVPFKPSGDRPVYCKECFAKRKEGGSFQGNYDNRPRGGGFVKERHFDKQEGVENRRPGRRHKPSLRKRTKRD
ncbi:MAG: hypothetical protein PHY56_06375 [Candidatus Omnitrophica bacterium]|nr:hypothetical protein [Candidatus Omnitrophota bacterium]